MVVLIGGQRTLKVDAHTHLLPQSWPETFDIPLRLIRYEKPTEKGFVARMEYKADGRLFRELKDNCFDPDAMLRECDEAGVDVQVVCTVPVMFNYHMPAETGTPWSQFLNDDLAQTCKRRPDRLVGLGTLPLQDTAAAVAEVGRGLRLGLVGYQIGSHVNAFRGFLPDGTPKIEQLQLNHPDLRPVWRECARLGACLMIHPWDMEWWAPADYWQPWLVGMPAETTLAGTALILGGVLSECPTLRVMMSHGGGALPFLMGRIEWGYRCRPDLVAKHCKEMPRSVAKLLYFDSITHDERMLQHLVDLFGPDKVMLGSDYPFPLGEVRSVAPVTGEVLTAYPGELIQSSKLSAAQKRMLLAGAALQWMGLEAEPFLGRVRDLSIPAQRADEDESNRQLPAHMTVYVVDAFTEKPYAGNPAAVVFVPPEADAALSNSLRKLIAAQMNLSETAYVTPFVTDSQTSADLLSARRFGLRWFTPDGTEVNLCGHATLATAQALIAAGNKSEVLTFETLSGPLTVTRTGAGLRMTLPNNAPVNVASLSEASILAAIGALQTVVQSATGMQTMDIEYSASTKKLLLRLEDGQPSLAAILALPADLPNKLRAAHSDGSVVKGVMVTVRTPEGPYDFQSRYFAPWVGIPEDPVTGSAHTVLAPYYQRIIGKSELSARQCSPRGGDLLLSVTPTAVYITGRAAVVLKGEIAVPQA